MGHPNEDLVRAAYAAFGRGDMEALQSTYFAESILWHFPGHSPFGGDYRGIDQVFDWFGRSVERSGGTLSVEVHDVVANDQHAVALTTVRAQRDGKRLEDQYAQIFHISDGKAVEVWTNVSDLYAVDDFWS
jgi:uncharacterized protein